MIKLTGIFAFSLICFGGLGALAETGTGSETSASFALDTTGGTGSSESAIFGLDATAGTGFDNSSAFNYSEGSENTYILTVDSGSGDGSYSAATVIDISADAPVTGKVFDKWVVSDSSYQSNLSDSTNPTTTFRMPAANATVTANFAQVSATASLTMAVNLDASGTTNPALGIHTVMTGVAQSIVATAIYGYKFTNWSTENASLADTAAPSTTVTLSGDATVTANFEAISPTMQLTMAISPAGSGFTSPAQNATIAVNPGVTTTIVATPAAGFSFVNWTANNANAVFADYSVASTTVTITDNVTLTANFEQGTLGNNVAVGSIYGLHISDIQWPSQVQTLANFAKKPKVYVTYKDPVSAKNKTSTLNVVTKIEKGKSVMRVDCEWIGKIALLNKNVWTADKTRTTQQILEERQMVSLVCRLIVSGEDDKKVKVKDVDTHIDVALLLPEISSVLNDYGQPTNIIAIGPAPHKITIVGRMFGKSVPAVWMEYVNEEGEVKQLKLKLDKNTPLKYRDVKGRPSCMDINTGVSEFAVLIPAADKLAGWQAGQHNIVIDNKVCRATIAFQTE